MCHKSKNDQKYCQDLQKYDIVYHVLRKRYFPRRLKNIITGGIQMNYEEKARGLFHKDGANCSQAVAGAFSDKIGLSVEEAMKVTPEPRSIEGKCGAVLASEMILEKLSIDKKDEFEERFKKINRL